MDANKKTTADEHRFTQINPQKVTKDSLENTLKLSSASRDPSSFDFYLPPSPLPICVNPRSFAVRVSPSGICDLRDLL